MTNIMIAIIVLFISIAIIVFMILSLHWKIDNIPKWHLTTHAGTDYMKVAEANKMIDKLTRNNEALGEEIKKLKLQLEIKAMNDFLQTGRL